MGSQVVPLKTVTSKPSPTVPSERRKQGPHAAIISRSASTPQFFGAIFNWTMWLLLMLLMLSQLLTVVNGTTKSTKTTITGQDPSIGLYHLAGFNDEPYSDRAVVCVRHRQNIKAMTVNDVLISGTILIEDTTGTALHGFRGVNRSRSVLQANVKQRWTPTCRRINSTLNYMLTVCEALGYRNLTRDTIRIVDGVSTKNVLNSLPVLIIPFYDNALTARYVIPGWDGHACVLRLAGNYEDPSSAREYIFGINRTIRESHIVDWLDRPGGSWKNGWYEDIGGVKWNGDVVFIDPYGSTIRRNRQFDPVAKRELECQNASDCLVRTVVSQWGEFHTTTFVSNTFALAVSNGERYGLFNYRVSASIIVQCTYDFSAFISNVSVISLLLRWMMAMVAMHRGYWKGLDSWHNAGIGAISNSKSFIILPIVMLPRLKMILAAFLSAGCEFEGAQAALSDAWFIMYPSIVDCVLIYASLLNSLAKLMRRRMCDWMIAPTILLLSSLHFSRAGISQLNVLGIGRVPAVIQPSDFDKLTFVNLFEPKNALQMSGNIASLLIFKLVVLCINLLPLVFSERMSMTTKRFQSTEQCEIENTLTIRVCTVGGFGRSDDFYCVNHENTVVLSAYELNRLGYVVFGDRYLIAWEDWITLTTVRQLRSVYTLWNQRIMVFKVEEIRPNVCRVSTRGRIVSLHDPDLNRIPWWNVDIRPIL